METHQKIADVITGAWENKDPELLRSYLAQRIYWREDTYSKPLRNPNNVIEQWQKDLATQSDIKIKIEVLAAGKHDIFYHCTGIWKDQKKGKRELDGIFQVRLNPDSKISYFNQWWTAKE